jgi:hypothetical protein
MTSTDDTISTWNTSNVTMESVTSKPPSLAYKFEMPPVELHYYHVAFLSVAIAMGVPGNSLVLAAYGCLRSKTSCDWYIMYIAAFDLIICLFRVPQHLATETGRW